MNIKTWQERTRNEKNLCAQDIVPEMQAEIDELRSELDLMQHANTDLQTWFDAASVDLEKAQAELASLKQQPVPEGYQLVPIEPTEAMWGGLARDIMMWLDFERKTPAVLFKHLERCGGDLPQWLREEPEMRNLDHVPSKGTRVSIIYKAMLAAAKEPS